MLMPLSQRVTGWVATQSQHVADTHCGIRADDAAQLRDRVRYRGQVSDRQQGRLSGKLPGDAHRAVAGGPSGPVGHRHEGRVQLLQDTDGSPELSLPRLVPGWGKLHGECRSATATSRYALDHRRMRLRHRDCTSGRQALFGRHHHSIESRPGNQRPGGRDRLNTMPDAALPDAVANELTVFFASRREQTSRVDKHFADAVRALEAFVLRGGKRVRPSFAWWGWRGAGGDPAGALAPQVLRACAALELIQACALVHDDLMDDSATRRGHPTVHTEFAARHRAAGWGGDAERFGLSAAGLL